MEFLILSDTHGRRRAVEQVMGRQVRPPDAILFLGDGLSDLGDRSDGVPVIRVRGNCDWAAGPFGDVSEEATFTFEGYRFFLTHGHRYGAKSGTGGLIHVALERGADLVLYGHTHTPALETLPAGTRTASGILERPLWLFNPGSLAEGSFGTLTLRPGTVLFSHGTL